MAADNRGAYNDLMGGDRAYQVIADAEPYDARAGASAARLPHRPGRDETRGGSGMSSTEPASLIPATLLTGFSPGVAGDDRMRHHER